MRGTLHPALLDEARFQRHRARTAAFAAQQCDHSYQTPRRAARARIAPWRTGSPPTEHAHAGELCVVVFAANAGRAPALPSSEALHQRHRARSTAAALNRRDHSFPIPWRAARARFARVDPANHPRSTRALADLAWLSSRSKRVRFTSCCWPRRFCNDTAPCRWLRPRNVATIAF